VQLKSGGYIVIGVTEALVAIDVNSGRATKEGSIEDTALKTNLEAAEEIARQLRLRDLAGLIVIDFIDMEERRNNLSVEKRIKDKLKTDRARIQVGRISGFGLLEMSRQRLRPGMLESTTQPCPHCHGTGLIRSDDSLGLQILRALEEEGTRKRTKEVLLRAPIGIVNFLINQKREHIALIEARYAMSVRIECDPLLVSPDYVMDKLKTATRVIPEPSAAISGNAAMMGDAVDEDDDIIDEDIVDDDEDEAEAEADAPVRADGNRNGNGGGEGDGTGKKKRRRRRRRRGGAGADAAGQTPGEAGDEDGDEDEPAAVAEVAAEVPVKAPSRSRTRKPKEVEVAVEVVPAAEPMAEVAAEMPAADAPAAEEKPKKPTRSRSTKPKVVAETVVEAEVASAPATIVEVVTEPVVEVVAAPAPAAVAEPATVAVEDGPPKPKRKGWWSLAK
jgi:ribonuclease E